MCGFVGATVFPFRKTNVRFETPPKRRKEDSSGTVQQGVSVQDDEPGPSTGMKFSVSPEMKRFGQHLMAEVEARTKYHLESG